MKISIALIVSFFLSSVLIVNATYLRQSSGVDQKTRVLDDEDDDDDDDDNSNNQESENTIIKKCLDQIYAFRFDYCDALRGKITLDEWSERAENYIHPGIVTSGFAGPGEIVYWIGRENFLHNETGLIPMLQNTAGGSFTSCIVVFSGTIRVDYFPDDNKIILTTPNIKAVSSPTSPGQGNLPGASNKFMEYEEDNYTFEKVEDDWLLSTYDDPNTVLSLKANSYP